MTDPAWQQLAENIATAGEHLGLDLVQPFSVARYNEGAAGSERVEDFGRSNALGLLVGNTRRLWSAFTEAYERDATLAADAQPLDTYVTTRLAAVLRQTTSARAHCVFAHVTNPSPFPIQRLAERIGFATVSPSHLAIHPLHGPWWALRAVVTIDVTGPVEPPPNPEGPCRNCSAPCLPALQRALAASGSPVNAVSVAQHSAEWIAVRDACPVGKASRYGAAQLTYHYAPHPSLIISSP